MDIERLAGTKLGNYEIESLLGRGGMGVVYKARQISLNRHVALKILPPTLSSDSSFVKRFQREAEAIARLDHPNIVQIFDTAKAKGLYFFSMQYVKGKTLEQMLKEKGRFDIVGALAIITQAALGIEHAHKNGIMHRDIKPSNIIVDESEIAKVMDFGLARSTQECSKLTRTGAILGTVDYMSPEQASGEKVIDQRTDIWSLGVILYEMLSGKTPFDATNDSALIHKIIYEEPIEVRSLNPDVPLGLSAILSRAMAKKQQDRYASVSEFLADISAFKALDVEDRVTDKPRRRTRPMVISVLEGKTLSLIAKRTPFVGRREEREELYRFLDKATFGQGSLVMIGGEPGVGKSRLTEELTIGARRRGSLCLSGHCYEMEGVPPYIPFVEIIESATQLVKPDVFRQIIGESAPEVAKLMPELRRKFSDIPDPLMLPPEQERRYMFNGVLDFIVRAAKAQNLLVVFEDLHWADESTLLLLQHIAPQLNDIPILLICTYRDTELEVSRPLVRIMEDLIRQRLVHDMILKRLSESDVAEMLRKRSGQEPPPQLLKAIYQETEGNPFFVEEVFKHLTEKEKLFDSGGRWHINLNLDDADVPRGVRLVVGHRLERVSKQCQQMLTTAAAIGRAASIELLEESVKLDEEVLLDAIDEAERAQIIRSITRAGNVQFVFTHELIRQTLLSDLSALRRQRLHARMVEAIEHVYSNGLEDHAAELAYHLSQAGTAANYAKAIRYLTLAGEQALKAAAFEDALRLYNNAHSLQSSDDARAQAELLYKRGLCLRSLARAEEALADWRETLQIYETLGDIEMVGRICAEVSTYLFSMAQFEEAYEVAIHGLAALEDRVNPDRCRLLATLGFLLSNVREAGYDAAHDLFSQALQMAEEIKNEKIVGLILGQKAFLHHAYWQGSQAAEVGLRAATLSQSIDPYNASYPFAYGGQCGTFWIGRLEDAARIGTDAEALASRAGNEHARWFAGHYDSFREVAVTGDLVRFENRRRALLEIELDIASGWITLSYSYLGRAMFWRGNWEEAREALLKSAEADVRGHTAGISDGLLFQLAAYQGNKAAALEILNRRRAILPLAGQPNMIVSWTMLDTVVEGLATLEEWHEAGQLYPLALEAIATNNIIRAGFCGLVQTTAGIAATAARQWDQAEEHYQIALHQAHEIPHLIEQPEIRRWYAQMLIERDASGDKEKAQILLAEAIEMYRTIGMPKHLEKAEELIGNIVL